MLLWKRIFLGLFLSVMFSDFVDSQICTKQQSYIRFVTETYTRSYRETYHGNCWYGCIKTRYGSVIDRRVVPKNVIEDRKVCCDGYMQDDKYIFFRCVPICSPPCENGYCKRPSECVCNKGYEFRDSHHKCSPICDKTCGHGTCVEPNKCECNFGYTFANYTCQPICTEPCVNGTCVAPDTCECLTGYRKNENNLCIPYCSNGCPHGTCISPENCVCDEGWYKNDLGTCAPRCNMDCGGGSCVSPDFCQCLPGYEKSDNGTCVPICSKGCNHGHCVGPENCTCNGGWSKNETGDCIPICDSNCGVGGSCVEPNLCVCNLGYHKTVNGTCVPFCSNGCPNGTCIEPEVCECNDGWNKSQSGACEPYCKNGCDNGICVRPNVCRCLSGYKISIANNPNDSLCMPECKNCTGLCISPGRCVYYTTSTENDEIREESAMWTTNVIDFTKNVLKENETDLNDDNINNADKRSETKNSSWSSYWMYAIVAVGSLILLIVANLVVKRKAIARMCHGGSYVVEDKKTEEDCDSLQS